MTLADYRMALAMRDVMDRLMKTVIDTERPRPVYGTVVTIDRVNRKCQVTLSGDTTSVPVGMGSVQPAAVGQIVRVEGLSGDRYIGDVMGPVYIYGQGGEIAGDLRITGAVNPTMTEVVATSGPQNYPIGVSQFQVTAGATWPNAAAGTVATFKTSSTSGYQIFTDTLSRVYFRYIATSSTWSAFSGQADEWVVTKVGVAGGLASGSQVIGTQSVNNPFGTGVPYRVYLQATVLLSATNNEVWDIELRSPSGSTIVATARAGTVGGWAHGTTDVCWVDKTSGGSQSASGTVSRVVGANNATSFADPRFNRLTMRAVPLTAL